MTTPTDAPGSPPAPIPPPDAALPTAPPPPSLLGRALRGGLLLTAARVAVQPFTWAATLIVARLVGEVNTGVFAAAVLYTGVADMLGEAGVGKALVQKPTLEPDDPARAFTFSAFLTGGLYLLLFAVADLLAVGKQPGYAEFFRLFALIVLLIPFRAASYGLLEREMRLGQMASALLVVSFTQAATTLALAYYGYGFWAMAVGAVVGRLLETIFLLWVSGFRPRLVWRRPSAEQKALLGFGFNVGLGTLLWYVYTHADYLVIERSMDNASLGVYWMAFVLISLPVEKVTANVNQFAYPLLCRLNDDPARRRAWFLKIVFALGVLCLPTLVGMALVARDGFGLVLGPKWDDAVDPFRLLAVVGVVMVFAAALPPLLMAVGRPDINLRNTVVCCLLLPPAFYLGARLDGLRGVCLAWVVVYPAIVAALVLRTRKLTGVGLLDVFKALSSVLFATAAMTAAVVAVQLSLPGMAFRTSRLVFGIGSGAIAYVLALALVTGGGIWDDLARLRAEIRK